MFAVCCYDVVVVLMLMLLFVLLLCVVCCMLNEIWVFTLLLLNTGTVSSSHLYIFGEVESGTSKGKFSIYISVRLCTE